MIVDRAVRLLATNREKTLTVLFDVFTRSIGLVATPFFLRYMTEGDFGIFAYGLTVGGAIQVLTCIGQYSTVARFGAEYGVENVFRSSIRIVALGSVLTLTIIYLGGDSSLRLIFPVGVSSLQSWLFIFVGVLLATSQVCVQALYSQEKFRTINYLNLFSTAVNTVGGLVLLKFQVFRNIDPVALRTGLQVFSLATTSLYCLASLSRSSDVLRTASLGLLENIQFSGPLYLSAIVVSVSTTVDRWAVASSFSKDCLGIYGLAYLVGNVLNILFSSVNNIYLVKIYSQTDFVSAVGLSYEFYRRWFVALILLAVPLSAVLFIYITLSHRSFAGVFGLFPIVYVTIAFGTLSQIENSIFNYLKRSDICLYMNLMSALACLCFVLLFRQGISFTIFSAAYACITASMWLVRVALRNRVARNSLATSA